jgi:methylaspartate mutase epsilon subunit
LPDNDELNLEEEMITQAVKAIVNKVVDLGDGDIAIGQIKAVEYGVIDAAFSPWRYLAKKTLPVRDATGAIRYLQSGNIPLPKEVVKYHKQRVDERKQSTRSKTDIEMVIEDVTRFSRPLFKEVIQHN